MTSVLNTSLIDKTGPKCSFIEHDTFPIVVKDLRTLDLIKQQVEHQEKRRLVLQYRVNCTMIPLSQKCHILLIFSMKCSLLKFEFDLSDLFSFVFKIR